MQNARQAIQYWLIKRKIQTCLKSKTYFEYFWTNGIVIKPDKIFLIV